MHSRILSNQTDEMMTAMQDCGVLTFLIPDLTGIVGLSASPRDALWTLPGRQSKVEEMVERLGGRHLGGKLFEGRRWGDELLVIFVFR